MKNTAFKKSILLFFVSFSIGFAQNKKQDGLFAELKTSKGTILLELAFTKTPITVANFVSLAEGKNEFHKESYKTKPFYDGLKFHRVIPNFMIQGGDPLGTGAGDPGYKFTDEFTDLLHDGPGVLSMANSGPNTNGSQFYITHKETSWLDGKHTVFGKVIEGQDVVNAIAQDDIIEKITIIRNGKLAKKFKADQIFKKYKENQTVADKKQAALNAENNKNLVSTKEAKQKKQAEIEAKKKKDLEAKLTLVHTEKKGKFEALKATATKTASGLQYVITKKGDGVKATEGTTVFIHYAGFFEDGKLFDSSYEDVSRTFGKFEQNRADQGGYAPFPFQYGNKGGLIAGFLEGVNLMSFGDKLTLFIPSNLGYGEQGAGGVIPPNSNLIFEVELLETK